MGSSNGTVDALVIGAGASGGAFSWSLANAGFDVMCLEQGDWIDPKSYPSAQQGWETHRQTDFSPDPNLRAQPQDYPVNNDGSPHRAAHVQRRRRQHDTLERPLPAHAPVRFPRQDAGRRRRRLAALLLRPGAVLRPERPDDRRGGGNRRPCQPAKVAAPDPAGADGQGRREGHRGLRQPRLALVALRQRRAYRAVRRQGALQQLRPVRHRLLPQGEGQQRRQLLAQGDRQGRGARDRRQGARDHRGCGRTGAGRRLL